MNLKELQDFIADFQRVSFAEMQLYLQIDAETLKPMLNMLLQNGTVQKSPTDEKCLTCQKCESEELEFYEWVQSV